MPKRNYPPLLLGAALYWISAQLPTLAANHPERRWMVHASPHFQLHFYPEVQGTAQRVLGAAEEVYARLRRDFDAPPGSPIPIILDQDAFFNGEAEPLKDRITLDPALANSSVVGTRRFVAHELAHVMTFRAVSSGHVLAKLNGLSTIPTWFLEGVAQYEAEYWYPSLDRMLRLATLENKLLTTSERQHFRMLGVHAGAAGYNEGYSLCRYMFETYGHERLPQLMRQLRRGKGTFSTAIARVFGTPLSTIEQNWRQGLQKGYRQQVKAKQDQVPGAFTLVPSENEEIHVQPRLSPNGQQLAFLTSRGQDRFLYLRGQVMGFLSLAIAQPDGRDVRTLSIGQGGISGFCWSGREDRLAFLQVVRDSRNNPIFALFAHELSNGKTSRLSGEENVTALSWRPDSAEVAFISMHDGHNTLKLVNQRTGKTRILHQIPNLVQWRDLQFSPDGNTLALVAFKPGEGGRLMQWRLHDGRLQALGSTRERGSDSSPCWTPDGRGILYSSDRSGFSQVYHLDLATGRDVPLTDTYRGAETPSVSPDGRLVYYSTYLAHGSRIEQLALAMTGRSSAAADGRTARLLKVSDSSPQNLPAIWDASALSQSSNQVGAFKVGAQGPRLPWPKRTGLPLRRSAVWPPVSEDFAKPYQADLSNDLLIPQMTADERGQQVGIAATYSDILKQHELGMDVRWGLWSQRFSYNAAYTNRMNTFSWHARLFDGPQIGIAPDAGTQGRPLFEHVYLQRMRGLMLGLETPLGPGRSLFSGGQMSTLETLLPPLAGAATPLRQGPLHTLNAVLREQRVRPTLDQDVNPSEGYRLALAGTLSDTRLGSAFTYSQWTMLGERYYPIIPAWRHHLTWRWGFGWLTGDAPVPFLLGGPNASSQLFALRGFAVGSFTGNRVASTGFEYVLPLSGPLDRTLGPLYLNRVYGAAFSEVGSAWNAGDPARLVPNLGAEIRLRGTIMGRQMLTVRLGVARGLGTTDAPGFYLTF